MKQITLTNGMTALVSDADYSIVSQYRWTFHNGYAVTMVRMSDGKRSMLYMHVLILGRHESLVTDHKNGNGLDNRRSNLRRCLHSQNGKNRKVSSNNTTGFKGVTISHSGRYKASIYHENKYVYLGVFDTAVEAAAAYNSAAVELHGAFARLNRLPCDG